MRRSRFALLCALVALSCVATAAPRATARAQVLCAEAVAQDARGDPRNGEGRIRQCWPGTPGCHCDGDGDCYALEGYAPCAPRAPGPPPTVLARLRLPADAPREASPTPTRSR